MDSDLPDFKSPPHVDVRRTSRQDRMMPGIRVLVEYRDKLMQEIKAIEAKIEGINYSISLLEKDE